MKSMYMRELHQCPGLTPETPLTHVYTYLCKTLYAWSSILYRRANHVPNRNPVSLPMNPMLKRKPRYSTPNRPPQANRRRTRVYRRTRHCTLPPLNNMAYRLPLNTHIDTHLSPL